MTEAEQTEARKVTQLSILITSLKGRHFVFNNLYQELRRQIDMGGFLGKGIERWREETERVDSEGNRVFTETGSPIIDEVQRSFKHPDKVEILFDRSASTIGAKRNNLLQKANGKYLCFIDDDDWVSKDYVKILMKAIQSEPDCVSLRGVMTTDGQNPEIFEHSLKYSTWRTTNNPIKYERYPNHLNCIKSEIAKQFSFPEINMGEDHKWSTKIHQSGLLKKEVYIEEVLYQYKFIASKSIA